MNEHYPIVSHSVLKEAQRSGLWGLGGQRRLDSDVPTLKPHEVLVYRVGGHFIVDDRRRSLDHSQVVNATSVSVVNMQRGADVAVSFEIISKDEAKFAVQVNFVCSVIDPITVVRDGQTNASEALLAYLKGYQPLFEIGLKHPLKEIHAVRREAGLHVKAYMTINPPQIPGMSIVLANVQVMTPQELAQHEELRRKEELSRQLELERLRGDQTLKQRKREVEHLLRGLEQRGEQVLKEQELAGGRVLKEQEQETDQFLAQRKQEGDHLLGSRQHKYELQQAMDVIDALGNDPRRALLLAHIRGEVSADDYARRLRAMDEEDQRRAREVKEAKRLAREKAEEIARAREREQDALEWDHTRETEAIARADRIREREWEQAQRQQEIEVELEVLREFNKRGLLDNYYPDINEIMRRIRGEPSVGSGSGIQVQGEERAQLTSGETGHTADESQEEYLKEEDGD